MKIVDLYSKMKSAIQSGSHSGFSLFKEDPELQPLEKLMRSWGMDIESTREWFKTPKAIAQEKIARAHLAEIPKIVAQVESAFGTSLPGTVLLSPSYDEFDGFARYDHGEHTVLLGIDFPGSDADYLKAITAHELSHVYRDHSPAVWQHLGKPLAQVPRSQYLKAATAQEHLVSEGLATLFSQLLYPEIPPVVHHYYEEEEWHWCESNSDLIHRSLIECLQGDADVWSYYAESRVERGSPSRTQYYWAAKVLSARLSGAESPLRTLVELHQLPATAFPEFTSARK